MIRRLGGRRGRLASLASLVGALTAEKISLTLHLIMNGSRLEAPGSRRGGNWP